MDPDSPIAFSPGALACNKSVVVHHILFHSFTFQVCVYHLSYFYPYPPSPSIGDPRFVPIAEKCKCIGLPPHSIALGHHSEVTALENQLWELSEVKFWANFRRSKEKNPAGWPDLPSTLPRHTLCDALIITRDAPVQLLRLSSLTYCDAVHWARNLRDANRELASRVITGSEFERQTLVVGSAGRKRP